MTKLREIYDRFADDPYPELSRTELLERIFTILRNRPDYEGQRPCGVRLRDWLWQLEKQLKRDALSNGLKTEPDLI